jgi:hypothetical protein
MFFNLYEAEIMMNERVKDELREAEQHRLGQVANSARPRLLDRLGSGSGVVASIGGLLLSAGKQLQERHAPVKAGLTVPRSARKPTTRPS